MPVQPTLNDGGKSIVWEGDAGDYAVIYLPPGDGQPVVQKVTLGKKLTDYSNRGVSGLDIDKDGETLTFGWQQERKGTTEYVTMPQCTSAFNSTSCIQIFKMRLDGDGLMQLTDIRRDNYHPIFLPSGRIAFISNRFGFLARCQGAGGLTGQFQVCGQLFSMKSDGSDVIQLVWRDGRNISSMNIRHDRLYATFGLY